MKKVIKNFCLRGMMFSFGGPVILAIVWFCLKNAGVMDTLSVNEVFLGIISSTVMAFLAAGISVVYDIEKLPKSFAALIHGTVLYLDYLICYLLNGWLPVKAVGMFTLIFAAVFIVIWLSIYIPIKIKISRLNKKIG